MDSLQWVLRACNPIRQLAEWNHVCLLRQLMMLIRNDHHTGQS